MEQLDQEFGAYTDPLLKQDKLICSVYMGVLNDGVRNGYYGICLPYSNCGDLMQLLGDNFNANDDLARNLFRQIAEGIAHLPSKSFIHADVKPNNVFVNAEEVDGQVYYDVAVGDFGSILKVEADGSYEGRVCGTPGFKAPEITRWIDTKPSYPVDVFSCGLVLVDILSGVAAFGNTRKDPQTQAAYYRWLRSEEQAHPAGEGFAALKGCAGHALDLVSRMLEPEPDARITMKQVLEQPWLTGSDIGGGNNNGDDDGDDNDGSDGPSGMGGAGHGGHAFDPHRGSGSGGGNGGGGGGGGSGEVGGTSIGDGMVGSTESINSMAANLTAQVHDIASVGTAIARGDLSRTITVDAVDVQGEMLQLKGTVNSLMIQLWTFAGEFTAANLTAQVRDIAGVTKAVARGELERKIVIGGGGEILELKDMVNRMADPLRTFAAEVTRVAREVAANLTSPVRGFADISAAVTDGDFKRFIDTIAHLPPYIDPTRAVHMFQKTINLPQFQLNIACQKAQTQTTTTVYNDLLIEEEDYKSLRDSIDHFNNFDNLALAQCREKRGVAKIVGESGDPELVEELLQFFIDNGKKEDVAACLYQCYYLLNPDVVTEIAWRNGLRDIARRCDMEVVGDLLEKLWALQRVRAGRSDEEEEEKEQETTRTSLAQCGLAHLSNTRCSGQYVNRGRALGSCLTVPAVGGTCR
ncbi:hypothetical protein HDV00_012174 [Rhizophlyctis rosea]|nr:hypothetical protein HDV00_012174 [Rhizophlyctis rosea]